MKSIEEIREGLTGLINYAENYNDLTMAINEAVVELLKEKYNAKPMENDPTRACFCDIGEIFGAHYVIPGKSYGIWTAYTTTRSPYEDDLEKPPLEVVMERREKEVRHSKEKGTRVTYDLGVVMTEEGRHSDTPFSAEAKRFYKENVVPDIKKLAEGIAIAKDPLEFCKDIKHQELASELEINPEVIKKVYEHKPVGV